MEVPDVFLPDICDHPNIAFWGHRISSHIFSFKKREGIPEMGTKPLRLKGDIGPLTETLKSSNKGL